MNELPYGYWPSDWTAEDAASASRDFAELAAGHGGLYWVQYDPADARSTLWFQDDQGSRCLTPEGVSLGSRVYEYGGGALCVLETGVAFVNGRDQQIYRQATDPVAAPALLTSAAHCRYAALCLDRHGQTLLAVEEDRSSATAVHRLVAFSLVEGQRSVIAEGADFYAAPCPSVKGNQLAWVEWSRPDQPWTATRLMLAERDPAGGWTAPRCIAGGARDQSIQQPRFAPDGRLHALSDLAGWWQPWVWDQGRWMPLGEASPGAPVALADHAAAPWQLGASTYLPLAEEKWLATRFHDGFGELWLTEGPGARRLATAFSRFRQLTADDRCFYAIAAAPDRLPAIIAIDRISAELRLVTGGEQPLAEAQLSRPQPLHFASGEGWAHAFFYPPRNIAHQGAGAPPLVIFVHGGPTSACYPVFDPRIQFWTQRGFAVADLNYRGSSGFGRAMRMQLKGEWGRLEVEDACALVEYLADQQRIDPQRVFIRGSSAGGYTALCALASASVFRGGGSLYGVSDPLSLRRATHKFEGDYLDWLIGDPEQDAERYHQRTPLCHADRITAPVIFFQGGQDAVVVPAQTESMVEALRVRGVPVEYRLYPGERHGFRQAANLADALEREYRFYQRLL
ncbi:alpha/beta hydrolase family protein [Stutzerimonas tarimensis]|uniref:Alpha/beta hydrolase family protein n=1 Tax=Stutzerimonas tarimensis TaxID=1507735 RepID=A0ABV7T255_9GAMM